MCTQTWQAVQQRRLAGDRRRLVGDNDQGLGGGGAKEKKGGLLNGPPPPLTQRHSIMVLLVLLPLPLQLLCCPQFPAPLINFIFCRRNSFLMWAGR